MLFYHVFILSGTFKFNRFATCDSEMLSVVVDWLCSAITHSIQTQQWQVTQAALVAVKLVLHKGAKQHL